MVASLSLGLIAGFVGLGDAVQASGTSESTFCFMTVSAPPEGLLDPCIAVSGTLQVALRNMVNAKPYKVWARDNPGELQKLMTYAASMPADGNQPPALATFFGMSLVQMLQSYAYVHGSVLLWPPANPVGSGSDKSPPSPPSQLHVSTGPVSSA